MKILVFSWFYPPIIGGVEVLVKRTVELLINLGFEVDLLTLEGSDIPSCRNHPLITVSRVTKDGYRTTYSGGCHIWLDAQACGTYQLVYAHNVLVPIELAISMALLHFCRRCHIPLIEHSHTIPRPSELYGAFSQVESKVLITVSQFLQDCFLTIDEGRSEHQFEREHIRIIHNPIDLETFQPDSVHRSAYRADLGVDDMEPLILFPSRIFDINGTLSMAKNAPLALEAFSHTIRLFGRGTLLFVAPPGFSNADRQEESVKELREMAARLNVVNRVRLLRRRLSAQEMVQYYNAADLSIIPSKESFCLSAVESVSCGTPVAGLAFGGLMEVLPSRAHIGLVAPGRNLAERLGQQMAILLSDRSKMEQVINAGREHVIAMCDSVLWNDRIRETVMGLLKTSVDD